jgi:hypothetical protein
VNELSTSVEIDAPTDAVWTVLTNFDAYPEWNPVMQVAGRPTEGARLTVELRLPGKRATTFRPTVTRVTEQRELRWLGHLLVAGLYDGDHRFELEPLADGRTRFTQAETFGGLLAGPINRWLGDATREGFERMNAALKARAESLASERVADVEVRSETSGDDVLSA